MTIGEKIRQLRKEKGLTQDAVASALEISRQAIAKWESDQSSPSTENLVKLSNLFNVSLEELVDVKQYQTAALEEYARRRLEEDQKKQNTKQAIYRRIRETLAITIVYIVVYAICVIVFHLAGVKNCIWSWMQSRHVLLITCLIHIAISLLDKKIACRVLLLGTVFAIIVANIAGMLMMQKSPIGYNNGWVIYLATLFVSFAVGLFVEFKVSKPNIKSFHGWRRGVGVAALAALSMLCLTCIILSVRHVKYGLGADNGYRDGYAVGAAEAKDGKTMDQNFSSDHYPSQYVFGSSEFKGHAVYWPEGYRCGYYASAQVTANTPE